MLCKCFRGMSVYLLYTLMTIPPCNKFQFLCTNFIVIIVLLEEQIFSTQSLTTQFCSSFNIDVSQYSINIAKLSTFNGHVSDFTSGIYYWAFLYSLNYKFVFSPPQALMTILKVVRLINLYTIPQQQTTPFTKLVQGSRCRIYHE